MTEQAVQAFGAEREDMLTVLRSLSTEEWAAPSGCAGWRVLDVTVHVGSGLELLVDPANAIHGDDPTAHAEARAEAQVAARRDWSPDRALAFFDEVSGTARETLATLQHGDLAESEIDLGDLGRHPMHLLANVFDFDLFTHLREDVLAPRGPIERPRPADDDGRVRPVVEWLVAGLPFMHAEGLHAALERTVNLRLEGPGGGEWAIAASPGGAGCMVTPGPDDDAVATVTSGAVDFVRWSTHRAPWRDHVTIGGDEAEAARVLDAIHLY